MNLHVRVIAAAVLPFVLVVGTLAWL